MEKLNILWTNSDEIMFDKMVAMYARNAKINGWWNEITILIWGSTAKLAANSELIELRIRELLQVGVNVVACKACSDSLGTTDKLLSMGVNVQYLGEELTRVLKSDDKLLSI